jgi:hypothetical protein
MREWNEHIRDRASAGAPGAGGVGGAAPEDYEGGRLNAD